MKNNIDKSNMHQVIGDSARQLQEGLDLAKHVTVPGNFSNIIVCGIGGSALPADILKTFQSSLPLSIHRDYNLPGYATKESLIICISYSGNTEETISALNEALQKGLSIISITSGGEIEKLCKEHHFPFVKVPAGIQPRCAIGYVFSALTKVLENAGMLQNISPEILEVSLQLTAASKALEKEGKLLSKQLYKKIPIIYSAQNLNTVAKIWKIKFNENSKVPAFYNVFPELNHNEMVGYTNIKKTGFQNFYVITLQDENDHPRILKRMQLTVQAVKKSGALTSIIKTKKGSFLYKVFSLLLLGDWASYYLALAYKVDPTPVAMVEEFKKMMSQ